MVKGPLHISYIDSIPTNTSKRVRNKPQKIYFYVMKYAAFSTGIIFDRSILFMYSCILQHRQVEKFLALNQILQGKFSDQHCSLRQTGGQNKTVTFHSQAVYSVSRAMLYYCPFYDFVPLLLSVENNYGYSTARWSNRWRGLTAWQCQTQVCQECLCTHGTPVPGNKEGILSCHQNWSPAWRQDRSFPAQARK